MQYSLSAQFILPVVAPRTQSKMSPLLHNFVGTVVHCAAFGCRSPNSVGPFSSGMPSPMSLYDSPGGLCPILIGAASSSFFTVQELVGPLLNTSCFAPAKKTSTSFTACCLSP